MYSFLLGIIFLIIGYVTYGKIIVKNFGPDDRITPAVEINDGVDFVPMPAWKVFLIQLLNIAGTGPIFGICLIVMALGVGGSLAFSGNFEMPEVWSNFSNKHAQGTPEAYLVMKQAKLCWMQAQARAQ